MTNVRNTTKCNIEGTVREMKKLILTIITVSAALGFMVPESAENVKHYFDENGNEHASYTLAGSKVAVASIKTNLKKVSADPVSGDRLH